MLKFYSIICILIFNYSLIMGQTGMEMGMAFSKDFHQLKDNDDEMFLSKSMGIYISYKLSNKTKVSLSLIKSDFDIGKRFIGYCATPPLTYQDFQMENTVINSGVHYSLINKGFFVPYVSLSLSHYFGSEFTVDRHSEPEFRQEFVSRRRPPYHLAFIPGAGIQLNVGRSVVDIALTARRFLYSGELRYPANLGFRIALYYHVGD